MTTIPSIEPATCSPAAGAPHVDAAASLPPVGPRACASEPLRSLPGAPRACASEPLRSLHAAALPFAQLLADNAILQSVLESIVAAPLSPTPSPERSVEASAPPTLAVPSAPPALAVPSAPPTLVGGDVLGAPRPGVEVPPAESSSVVSPVVSTRPDAAVEDGSSVAARRGRRALPSEGTVQGAAPSVPSAPRVPSTTSAPPVPPTLAVPSAPPALVGGDVLGAPRPGVEVPPAESSSVVSPVVSTRPDAAVVDESSVAAFAARRGRRALPSEGAVPGAVPSVPSAPSVPSTTSAPPALSAPPVPPTLAVPSAPSTLVGGDVLGASRPGAEVPPAESSPVVSPGVPVRPDAAVVDESSVAAFAARRGRRALPSEGAVPGAVPSVPSAPSVPSTTSAPPALSAPPVPPTLAVPSAPSTLVGGDVLGASRPGAEVPPAESSPVVSPGVPVRPDAAVVDESSVAAFAARRGRRALPSEGAVQKAASSAPSAPSASSAPPTPSALPVSLAVPEISAPAAAPTAAPVTAVEAVVAAFTPSVTRAVEPAQVLVEAARAVADTLLVTPGLLRGEGEIRIQLRPDVLDGTEIHIAVAGRQLTVAFTPPTPDLVALIEQSRPQLTAHLAERIHSFQIAVDVRRRVRSEERG